MSWSYPPQSPLGKGGSVILPLTKGELEGVFRGAKHMRAIALPAGTTDGL